MTLKRMDNVLIVVADLEGAKAFFAELGMELEGQTLLEGPWVDLTVGLDGVRADIAMMRTPDSHGRVELTRFHTPPAVRPSPRARRRTRWAYAASCSLSTTSTTSSPACAPTVPSSSARSRMTRTATGSASCVPPRASSADWPNSSAEPRRARRERPPAGESTSTVAVANVLGARFAETPEWAMTVWGSPATWRGPYAACGPSWACY